MTDGSVRYQKERETRYRHVEETTDDDILLATGESAFPAVTTQWLTGPRAERETVIRSPRYLPRMGLLQDVLCISGIRHDYGDAHGGMKRCRNCGNVEETE